MRRGAEEEILGDGEARRFRGISGEFGKRELEFQFDIVGSGVADFEIAGGDGGEFAELQIFVIGERTRCFEKQHAKSMAGEAIVAEEALEIGLLHTDLIVDGNGRAAVAGIAGGFSEAVVVSLGTALDRVDERGSGGAEVEGGDGGTVGRLEKDLVFGRGEEKLGGAVGIVIEKFDAGNVAAGSELIDERFGANKIAPKFGAEMRGVESAENTVPVSVISLPS